MLKNNLICHYWVIANKIIQGPKKKMPLEITLTCGKIEIAYSCMHFWRSCILCIFSLTFGYIA